MRTSIEFDEKLLEEAMAATGLPIRKATVEEALRSLVRRHRQKAAIGNLAGPGWDDDLAAMRQRRTDQLVD